LSTIRNLRPALAELICEHRPVGLRRDYCVLNEAPAAPRHGRVNAPPARTDRPTDERTDKSRLEHFAFPTPPFIRAGA